MRKDPWLGYTPTSKSRRYAALAREGIVHSYAPAGQFPSSFEAEAEAFAAANRPSGSGITTKQGAAVVGGVMLFNLLLLGGAGYLIYRVVKK